MAVASAGPYANHLHLAADRQPSQHLISQFLQARCCSWCQTNTVKALKASIQQQGSKWKKIHCKDSKKNSISILETPQKIFRQWQYITVVFSLLKEQPVMPIKNGKIWDVKTETPKPTDTKFDMGDYICNITHTQIIEGEWPIGGILTQKWNITLTYVFTFLCDPDVCSPLETKPQNRFSHFLIHRRLIPGYCLPRQMFLLFIWVGVQPTPVRTRDVHRPKIFGPARPAISRPFCGPARPAANFGPARPAGIFANVQHYRIGCFLPGRICCNTCSLHWDMVYYSLL